MYHTVSFAEKLSQMRASPHFPLERWVRMASRRSSTHHASHKQERWYGHSKNQCKTCHWRSIHPKKKMRAHPALPHWEPGVFGRDLEALECEHEISAQRQERTYNRVPATRWRDLNQQERARSLNQRMMRTGWYGHTQSSPKATSEGDCIRPRNPVKIGSNY